MYAPDDKWRCTEDLKVILIAKEGKLTKNLALSFYTRFGKVKDCYVLKSDKMACGIYETEEEAEEALKENVIKIGRMRCDVTTFKSGNRKIFVSPLDLPHKSVLAYFETNYGKVLRFETISGCSFSAAFILFLKVDSAVACRNMHHCINGVTITARAGCTPGTDHQPGRSTMYRIASPRPTGQVTPQINKPSIVSSFDQLQELTPFRGSSSFQSSHTQSPFFSPELNESSSVLSRSDPDISHLSITYPQYRELLEALKDRSVDEIDGRKKRRKKDVNKVDKIIDWRNSHLNMIENGPIRRGAQIILESPQDEEEETEAVNEGEQEGETTNDEEAKRRMAPALPLALLFPPSEKELQWEERRKELNLPPMVQGTHYALDEEGFPIHHNGKYIHSIFKDGRFIFNMGYHVSFNIENNDVRLFKRSEEEYKFLGRTHKKTIKHHSPMKGRTPKKASREDSPMKGRTPTKDNNDDSSIDGSTPKGEDSDSPKWPFSFPKKPLHFPLMEFSSYEDSSLEVATSIRYLDHLEARWKNTKQTEFLSEFGHYLISYCPACNVKLIGPKKQFEHIFSRPHLDSMDRHVIKYTASDFTFWNNLLLIHFRSGGTRPYGKDRAH